MKINSGDVVEFKARGETHVGVVLRVRVKQRRKLKRMAREFGFDSSPYAETLVAEVSVGKSTWTVPVDWCTITGEASEEAKAKAYEDAQAIKVSIINRKHNTMDRNYENAKENNILDLIPGQSVEVQFRDIGWQKVTFLRFTGTGNIIFRNRYGNEQRVGAKYCRATKQPEQQLSSV